MNNKYNGWTNWETWVVNLWLGDGWGEIKDPDILKEIVEEHIDQIAGKYDGTILVDIIQTGFLSEVNWDELAENNNGLEQDEEELECTN